MLNKISITKPFFLNINSKIIDAFKIINSNQVGACILTNSKGEFMSLITDGDLRRLILSNIDLNSSLTFFINKKTKKPLKDQKTKYLVSDFQKSERDFAFVVDKIFKIGLLEKIIKEIAENTNVSINTALGRMRYAIINLRKMISDNQIALET